MHLYPSAAATIQTHKYGLHARLLIKSISSLFILHFSHYTWFQSSFTENCDVIVNHFVSSCLTDIFSRLELDSNTVYILL